jgi:hypothetical protein
VPDATTVDSRGWAAYLPKQAGAKAAARRGGVLAEHLPDSGQ